jgi:hypothetical protein
MVKQIEQVEQLQALQSLVKEYYTAAQIGKQMEDPTAYESRNLILPRFDRKRLQPASSRRLFRVRG